MGFLEETDDAIVFDVEVHVIEARARGKPWNHFDVTADAHQETGAHRRAHFTHLRESRNTSAVRNTVAEAR